MTTTKERADRIAEELLPCIGLDGCGGATAHGTHDRDCPVEAHPAVSAKLQELMEDNDRLREALEFYADPISYAITQVKEPRSAIHYDKGRKARAALDGAAS